MHWTTHDTVLVVWTLVAIAAVVVLITAFKVHAFVSLILALAIGSGSLFLSHVNDAGFWLVKEYFGMTVGQTFKTWSVDEVMLAVSPQRAQGPHQPGDR
jgi:gluconate:H+ symporter, GntP family